MAETVWEHPAYSFLYIQKSYEGKLTDLSADIPRNSTWGQNYFPFHSLDASETRFSNLLEQLCGPEQAAFVYHGLDYR